MRPDGRVYAGSVEALPNRLIEDGLAGTTGGWALMTKTLATHPDLGDDLFVTTGACPGIAAAWRTRS